MFVQESRTRWSSSWCWCCSARKFYLLTERIRHPSLSSHCSFNLPLSISLFLSVCPSEGISRQTCAHTDYTLKGLPLPFYLRFPLISLIAHAYAAPLKSGKISGDLRDCNDNSSVNSSPVQFSLSVIHFGFSGSDVHYILLLYLLLLSPA